MITLKKHITKGYRVWYSNELGMNTPDGEIFRVEKVFTDDSLSVFSHYDVVTKGNLMAGTQKTQTFTELPEGIILSEENWVKK